jgi:hypothetical protein
MPVQHAAPLRIEALLLEVAADQQQRHRRGGVGDGVAEERHGAADAVEQTADRRAGEQRGEDPRLVTAIRSAAR